MMELKNSFHAQFCCFFMSFFFMFFCAFLRTHANFYFFIYLPHIFYYLFLFFIPPCDFNFYISPMCFLIFLSFIYAIVSVIFYMRQRPLRLRLLFLRVQNCSCFLLLLPFFILPKLHFCFLLFLPFSFLLKGSISSFFSCFVFSQKSDLCFLFFLRFPSRKRFMLCLMFLRVQLHFCFLRFLPFLSSIKSSVSVFSSFFLFSLF